MDEKTLRICQGICEDRNILYKKMRWETEVNQVAILSAFMYASEGRRVDAEQYVKCKKLLKKKVNLFSEIRGIVKTVVITKMALSNDPEAYIEGVTSTYKKLRERHKFTASAHMVLAAMTIYEKGGETKTDEYIDIMESLYKKMNAEHRLLTSDSDRALIAIMATSGKDVTGLLEKTFDNYETFKGMHIGRNSIYSMAQALSESTKSSAWLREEILALKKGLKKAKKPISKTYGVTVLSLLTLLDVPTDEIVERVVEVDNYLKTQKGFKWYNSGPYAFRTMYSIMAVILSSDSKNDAAVKTAMASTMTYIISVLIMIMVASTTAAIRANSSSSAS